MKTFSVEPVYLKSMASGRPIGVDRANKTIQGYVVALHGPFKDLRGEFDDKSLAKIVELGNASPAGLKSRFTHPGMSDDGLGKHLGRAKNFTLDQATAIRDGKPVTVPAVRGDLHLNDAAFHSPSGDLGTYIMDLAESDSDAMSSSLVLRTDKEKRLNPDGTAQKDKAGNELPPLWRPKLLHASDVVDDGAAVDGFLGLDRNIAIALLPDAEVRLGVELLDRVFEGQPRDVVEGRVLSYLRKYLDLRFGDDEIDAKRAALKAKLAGLGIGAGSAQLEKVG